MSTPAHTALGDALEHWAPAPTETVRPVDPGPASVFAALPDIPSPVRGVGDPLPPLWHWFTLVEVVAQSDLGADGHPADGPFMPPIPARTRMFAGGRLRQWAPITFGAELTGRAYVASVRVRIGRSGEMACVTVREELLVDGTTSRRRRRTWSTAPQPTMWGRARSRRPGPRRSPASTPGRSRPTRCCCSGSAR